jgi:hypothetical protein
MKKAFFLSIIALWAAPAVAAESAQCDAKPFTLGKPAAVTPAKPKPKPEAKPEAGVQTQSSAPRKTNPKPEARLLATCKTGKTGKPKKRR